MKIDPRKYEYLADNPNVKVMPIMVSLIHWCFFCDIK